MRIILIALLLSGSFVSCNQQTNYKTERDEVMKFHDVLMQDNGILINNQMKIDTLLKNIPNLKAKYPDLDTLQEKKQLNVESQKLKLAEELMNDWMHKFEPDITGKSNEEASTYFKKERLKIGKIDSLYKIHIKSSNAYLSKFGR